MLRLSEFTGCEGRDCRRFPDSTVIFFPRTGYTNNISHRRGVRKAVGHKVMSQGSGEQPHWSAWDLALPSLSRAQSLF